MTFKEKLMTEHPDQVSGEYAGECKDCPCKYGYESETEADKPGHPCFEGEGIAQCVICWNREIPGTEPTADDNSIYQSILYTAINEFGADAQIKMMFEEMSELQHALCKHLRGKNNEDNIAEEIADVQIMLDQMIILFECEQKAKMYYSEKIKRLADNIGYKPEKEGRR